MRGEKDNFTQLLYSVKSSLGEVRLMSYQSYYSLLDIFICGTSDMVLIFLCLCKYNFLITNRYFQYLAIVLCPKVFLRLKCPAPDLNKRNLVPFHWFDKSIGLI